MTTGRAYAEMHIAVLLFGLTAILGDLIALSGMVIVWWRVLLTSVSLLFFRRVYRHLRAMPAATRWRLMGIGVIVGLHWICFYGAIKLSSASVTLICMATTSLFTAFLEPLFFRKPIEWLQVGLGLMVIPGMAFIVNYTPPEMWWGIAVAVLSALLAVVFSILNKRYVATTDTYTMTLVELGSAWAFISLLLPFFVWGEGGLQFWPTGWEDVVYLLILALLCTTLAYILSLRALRILSAFASNLTINLEPVYGIVLAFFLLDDYQELSPNFYIGVGIIVAAVFAYPVLERWRTAE